MNQYLKFADLLFNQPLLATETLATSVTTYLAKRMLSPSKEDLAVNFDKTDKVDRNINVTNSTAIIPIMGGLTHRSTGMDAMCSGGLGSYAGITKAFDQALADDSVDQIVLHVDSGGGQAVGCFDLANHIYSSRGQKPIIAYVDGMAASAAYALASSADEVIASPNADVGSIGVVMVHQDYSKMLDKEGIKSTVIKAGANKALGSPYEPLSQESQDMLQSRINEMYDGFTALVAQNRPITQSDAKATEASVYNSQEALSKGLIDKIMTPAEFANYISSQKAVSAPTQTVAASAQVTNQETEMSEQEQKELLELREFKAQAEAAREAEMLADQVAEMQPLATKLGFDAQAAVAQMSTMSEEQKNFTMSVINSASANVDAINTQMEEMTTEHAKQLEDAKASATAAVEESGAMSELTVSGEAEASENVEKAELSQDQIREMALLKALNIPQK